MSPSSNDQPIHVVAHPARVSLAAALLSGARKLLGSLLTAVITAALLAYFAPRITSYIALASPTCSDPRGLRKVSSSAVKPTGQAEPGSWGVEEVNDDYPGSIWIPPLLDKRERASDMTNEEKVPVFDTAKSRLTLTLDKTRDIRLVCGINGLANSPTNYLNWGRVRTIEAWTDSHVDRKRMSIMQTLDQSSFATLQGINIKPDDARRVHVRPLDAYVGQQVTSNDPDLCGTRDQVGNGNANDPVGCNLNPDPKAGLSEIVLYEKAWSLSDIFRGTYP